MSQSVFTFVVGVLIFLICLGVSTFVILYLDMRSWGARLQTAVAERNEVEDTLQKTRTRLQDSEKKLVRTTRDKESLVEELTEHKARLTAAHDENEKQVQALAAANQEIARLNHDLNLVNEHLDDLRSTVQSLQAELATAERENLLHQQTIERYESRLETVRLENQDICQRLAVADVEIRNLQKDLQTAAEWEAKAAGVQNEKEAIQAQLTAAETEIGDVKSKLDGALQQVTETQYLRKRLLTADQNMKAAHTQIEVLQGKLAAVQNTLSYTGKNQLQIIRGIGPAYARRLNEAGVSSLNDLAKCEPEQLKNIVQLKPWQNGDPADWIQEAKALTIKLGES